MIRLGWVATMWHRLTGRHTLPPHHNDVLLDMERETAILRNRVEAFERQQALVEARIARVRMESERGARRQGWRPTEDRQ